MRIRHSYLVYDSVPYDEVATLLPFSSLPSAAVTREARAAERLAETDDDDILAVGPVSMATGYRIAQEPLTVVDLSLIDDTVTGSVPIDEYELLVIGRPRDRENHSLTEYA